MNSGNVKDGILYECVKNQVPYVLVGSVRDDGPLPEVYGNVYEGQNAMREQVKRATTVICMASTLHTVATGNMTPSYRVVDGAVRPVYFYSVDISEFAVNKLRDRGSLSVRTIVTNVQDFIVNVQKAYWRSERRFSRKKGPLPVRRWSENEKSILSGIKPDRMLSRFPDLLQLPMPMARTFRVAGRSPLQRGRCAYLRGRTTVKHVPGPGAAGDGDFSVVGLGHAFGDGQAQAYPPCARSRAASTR